MDKQYAERDIMALDKAGGYYCRHLSAMTGEGLHDKSDIAAELAYRDARIAQLEADCAAHKSAEEVQIALREKADEREAALARDASYHQQEIDSLLGRLRKTQTERDVHMAHSARVNEVLFKTFSAIEDGDESALPYDEYRDAFNDAPTASLARRDAEILEYMASEIKSMHPKASKDGIAAHLLCVATSYRQQTEVINEPPA